MLDMLPDKFIHLELRKLSSEVTLPYRLFARTIPF